MKKSMLTPIPTNISYLWNFGSSMMFLLGIQLMSGLIISMNYNSSIELAFSSIERMMRYVDNSWMIRMIHINGASMYFLVIYMHMFKNMMFKSWMMTKTWESGMMILIMSMATAFMGYVLPWGQMSFWAATVITNLFSAIPIMGNKLVSVIWGSFSVSAPTLNRFFTLHFIMPFLIVTMMIIHIMSLHEKGSSNPLGISMNKDKTYFNPLFTIKDSISISIVITMIMMTVMIDPYKFIDSENMMMANPMMTPEKIKPEWYFLFIYSILRTIPSKLGGVCLSMMTFAILLMKPNMKNENKFSKSMNHKINMSILTLSFMMLTILGSMPMEMPYSKMMSVFSITFFYSIIIM